MSGLLEQVRAILFTSFLCRFLMVHRKYKDRLQQMSDTRKRKFKLSQAPAADETSDCAATNKRKAAKRARLAAEAAAADGNV